MMTHAIELPLHCPHCGGAISMQMVDWPESPEPDADDSSRASDLTWTCPYCARPETMRLRGRLAWVARRSPAGEAVN